MVEGAVPGAKGGWIQIRDAVKKPAPQGRRDAGFVQARSGCRWGEQIMDIQVTSLDGKDAGSLTLKDEIFGLEPRADILHRMVRYQQLKAMAGTHKVKHRSEIAYTGKKFGEAEGFGRRPPRRPHGPAVPRRWPGLRSGAAQPRDRPSQEGPRAGAEACAFGQGQGRRAVDRRHARHQGAQDRGAARAVRQARVDRTR